MNSSAVPAINSSLILVICVVLFLKHSKFNTWFGITIVRLLLSYHDSVTTITIVNILSPSSNFDHCFCAIVCVVVMRYDLDDSLLSLKSSVSLVKI